MNEKIEARRSFVRISMTWAAGIFLFFGGALLIGAFFWKEDYLLSKDLFLAIMPIASAIISYWFASRDKGRIADGRSDNEGQKQ